MLFLALYHVFHDMELLSFITHSTGKLPTLAFVANLSIRVSRRQIFFLFSYCSKHSVSSLQDLYLSSCSFLLHGPCTLKNAIFSFSNLELIRSNLVLTFLFYKIKFTRLSFTIMATPYFTLTLFPTPHLCPN